VIREPLSQPFLTHPGGYTIDPPPTEDA